MPTAINKNSNKAPKKACYFERCGEQVEFTRDEKQGFFNIIAYSGGIIPNHWWWGNLAFDLNGGKFEREKTPIVQNHQDDVHIGFSTEQEISKIIRVKGPFLSNEKAQQLKKDMDEGFPMQASPHVSPLEVEYVKQGQTVEVNGHILAGPGTVFRKWTIPEVSMCLLGWDKQTLSETFADDKTEIEFNIQNKEITIMDPKKEQTQELMLETFSSQNPLLFAKIKDDAKAEGKTEGKKEGVKETRELFAKFAERFGDDAAFCIEQFKAGATIEAATVAQNAKLKTELTEAKKAQPEKKDPTEPARTEFRDTQKPPPLPANTDEMTDEQLKEKFSKDKDLQEEFGGDEASYIAYIKAEKNGQVGTGGKDNK